MRAAVPTMAETDVPLADIAKEITKKPELRTGTRETSTDMQGDAHAEALLRYEAGYNKERKNQDLAYEDLKFLTEEGQWEAIAKQVRESEQRPILTINKCPQFVRQVTGDIRQMRPAIKVVPVDEMADKDIATKILPGMIRYIEQRSDAKGAYFAAADQQVAAGIGHCRVYTEVANSTTMEQEICIGQVEDGIAVIWDPDAIHPSRRDAMWCFVPVDMAKATFEKKYPNKNSSPLTESKEMFHTWFTDDYVRISEYWRKVPIKRRIAIYPGGQIIDLTDDPDGSKQSDVDAANEMIDRQMAMQSQMQALQLQMQAQPGMAPPPVQPPLEVERVEIEERDSYQVERFLITAQDILEGPQKWPGAHIPIAPCLGEETKIGREIVRNGIIRPIKDVQRSYNYAASAEAEVVALQPKAPYKGTKKNFEEFIDQWETANSRNHPFLEYTPDGANNGKAPEREPPPVASSGIEAMKRGASEDFSAVTGIYPAALGANSNETSGVAIRARDKQGDTGSYVYIENFGRMVQRIGEIVVDLIPRIYDTKRTIRIVGEDGKIDMLEINKEVIDPDGNGIATVTMNDLTVGTYEVVVEMGPSYSTKREEARDGMQAFMQAAGPGVAQLYIDLFAKMQDWPLADKIAKRANALLPRPIQEAEAKEAGEEPPAPIPPPPPTPEQEAAIAEAKHTQEMDKAKLLIEGEKVELERERIQNENKKADRAHECTMAGHALSLKQFEKDQDDRIDALAQAVKQLNELVIEVIDAVGVDEGGTSIRKQPSGTTAGNGQSSPDTKSPSSGSDLTPRLVDIIGQMASKKTPTGVTRTPNGMQLTFDEPTPPAGPPNGGGAA